MAAGVPMNVRWKLPDAKPRSPVLFCWQARPARGGVDRGVLAQRDSKSVERIVNDLRLDLLHDRIAG